MPILTQPHVEVNHEMAEMPLRERNESTNEVFPLREMHPWISCIVCPIWDVPDPRPIELR